MGLRTYPDTTFPVSGRLGDVAAGARRGGEETILVASVTGVMALLRPAVEERDYHNRGRRTALDATRFVGYLLLPVTLAVGVDVVVHGHLPPGGGF